MSGTPKPPAPSSPTPCTTERALAVGVTTVDDRDAASRLAGILVDEGLVACAQVSGSPVTSHYRWKGKRETADEYTVTLKFPDTRADEVEKRLLELHPYETPQWYVLVADRVSPAYLAWVLENTSPA